MLKYTRSLLVCINSHSSPGHDFVLSTNMYNQSKILITALNLCQSSLQWTKDQLFKKKFPSFVFFLLLKQDTKTFTSINHQFKCSLQDAYSVITRVYLKFLAQPRIEWHLFYFHFWIFHFLYFWMYKRNLKIMCQLYEYME